MRSTALLKRALTVPYHARGALERHLKQTSLKACHGMTTSRYGTKRAKANRTVPRWAHERKPVHCNLNMCYHHPYLLTKVKFFSSGWQIAMKPLYRLTFQFISRGQLCSTCRESGCKNIEIHVINGQGQTVLECHLIPNLKMGNDVKCKFGYNFTQNSQCWFKMDSLLDPGFSLCWSNILSYVQRLWNTEWFLCLVLLSRHLWSPLPTTVNGTSQDRLFKSLSWCYIWNVIRNTIRNIVPPP